jgi:hypothetical protein
MKHMVLKHKIKIIIYLLIIVLVFLNHKVYSQGFELNSGVTVQLNSSSPCMINPYPYANAWACGINGTVIKSANYPNNWLNVSGNGLPNNINMTNICGVDSSIAFVTGALNSNTWIWKTTNAGQNWYQVFNQSYGKINAIWMKNYLQGFMQGNPVGGRWSLWKTTNGGDNWDSAGLYLPQSGNETGWANSLCMFYFLNYPNPDSNNIWFGTNNYRIYYTSNYGQNWSVQSTAPEQNTLCLAVQFGQLYAGGSTYLLHSSNYGYNWQTDSIGGNGPVCGISAYMGVFLVARENKIYSKDYQGNWALYYTSPSGNYCYIDNKIPFHFAVRTNGGITLFAYYEEVQKLSSEIPNYYSLSQNYPNPFNPKSKIKFDIAKSGDVKLIIYDVLGREVATLVNERLKAGTYEAEWDASSYSSGVYFYKLITEGYTETRKMVLVK